MSEKLKEIYREGRSKGLISQGYTVWRGSVVSRINKLYRTNYHNLTDEEISDYIERAKFYKELKNN